MSAGSETGARSPHPFEGLVRPLDDQLQEDHGDLRRLPGGIRDLLHDALEGLANGLPLGGAEPSGADDVIEVSADDRVDAPEVHRLREHLEHFGREDAAPACDHEEMGHLAALGRVHLLGEQRVQVGHFLRHPVDKREHPALADQGLSQLSRQTRELKDPPQLGEDLLVETVP